MKLWVDIDLLGPAAGPTTSTGESEPVTSERVCASEPPAEEVGEAGAP